MAKPKVKGMNAQQRLIHAIIRKHGGPLQAARLVTQKTKEPMNKQTFTNWNVRGLVPLEQLLFIADVLKVEPYCLNYEGYSKMIRKEKEWKKVVEDCKILNDVTKKWVITGVGKK